MLFFFKELFLKELKVLLNKHGVTLEAKIKIEQYGFEEYPVINIKSEIYEAFFEIIK